MALRTLSCTPIGIPEVGTILEITPTIKGAYIPNTRFYNYRARVISVAKTGDRQYLIMLEGFNVGIVITPKPFRATPDSHPHILLNVAFSV